MYDWRSTWGRSPTHQAGLTLRQRFVRLVVDNTISMRHRGTLRLCVPHLKNWRIQSRRCPPGRRGRTNHDSSDTARDGRTTERRESRSRSRTVNHQPSGNIEGGTEDSPVAHVRFSWVMFTRTTGHPLSLNHFQAIEVRAMLCQMTRSQSLPGVKDGKILGDRPSQPSSSSGANYRSIAEYSPHRRYHVLGLKGPWVSTENGLMESSARYAKMVVLLNLATGNVKRSRDPSSRCVNKLTGAIRGPIHPPRVRYWMRQIDPPLIVAIRVPWIPAPEDALNNSFPHGKYRLE